MTSPVFFTKIHSPVGELTIAAIFDGICGIYFSNHENLPKASASWVRDDGTRFAAVQKWLRSYFAGTTPLENPALVFAHGTDFQKCVWRALQTIPRGETRSYGDIARSIGRAKAVRAVGAAIGRNPLSILVPCHRVIGSNGSLTGFAGGLDRKRWLLAHEGVACP